MEILKINSDASFTQHNSKVFGCYIVRNRDGIMVAGGTYRGFAISPLVAEALVLRDAVIFANNLHLNKIIVESNNLQLIQACRGEV